MMQKLFFIIKLKKCRKESGASMVEAPYPPLI